MIESIDLRFIRCYDHCQVRVCPGINLFFGKNGVGKTTLLEAAQIISTGQSFKVGYLYEVIQSGYEAGKIRIQTQDHPLAMEIHRRSKKYFIGEHKIHKQQDFIGKITTVLLAPEHNAMIEGSKQGRQAFVDHILMQQDPGYTEVLKKQQKVLTQKRALLKQELPYKAYLDHALVWHQQNHALTEIIRKQRKHFLAQTESIFAQTYQEVSQKNSILQISYVQNNDHAPLGEALLRQEYYAKRVLYGAQRDDLDIQLEARPTQKHASQGEKATILLSMKWAELLILQKHDKAPIFLLDDIGTTLDQTRRQQLFAKLQNMSCQTLISTCDPYIQQEIVTQQPDIKNFTYSSGQKKWQSLA